jgi:hypothetical protein
MQQIQDVFHVHGQRLVLRRLARPDKLDSNAGQIPTQEGPMPTLQRHQTANYPLYSGTLPLLPQIALASNCGDDKDGSRGYPDRFASAVNCERAWPPSTRSA